MAGPRSAAKYARLLVAGDGRPLRRRQSKSIRYDGRQSKDVRFLWPVTDVRSAVGSGESLLRSTHEGGTE